jgi:exoenzyme U
MELSMGEIKTPQTVNNYQDSKQFKSSFLNHKTIKGVLGGREVTTKEKLHTYTSQITQDNHNTKILGQSIGGRETTIIEYEDGGVDMFCTKPEASNLVLSAGGAKGWCCQGVFNALEETDRWKHIDKISGTSIGAMMGLLMSTGMQASELQSVTDNIKASSMIAGKDIIEDGTAFLWELDSKDNISLATNKNDVPKTIVEKIKLIVQIVIALFTGKKNRACKLEIFLSYVTASYFLKKINELDQEKQQEIQDLIKKLEFQKSNPTIANKPNARITFADLDKLSEYIPGMKKLEVNATIVINGRAQIIVYSGANTPDMDIYTQITSRCCINI